MRVRRASIRSIVATCVCAVVVNPPAHSMSLLIGVSALSSKIAGVLTLPERATSGPIGAK